MADPKQDKLGDRVGNAPEEGGPAGLAPFLDDREKQIQDDYEWCLHDPEVRRLYAGQVVVAHQKRIWGTGPNHTAAFQAAQRDPACPPSRDLAFVVVPDLAPASFVEAEAGA
jgi:hypothetical protein